jgi:hypothetical protein
MLSSGNIAPHINTCNDVSGVGSGWEVELYLIQARKREKTCKRLPSRTVLKKVESKQASDTRTVSELPNKVA